MVNVISPVMIFPLYANSRLFFVNFGDGNWRQAETWTVLLAGAVEVNAHAQGALRQFTQWLWIEHPTFRLRGGHFITELLPPRLFIVACRLILKIGKESIVFERLYFCLLQRNTLLCGILPTVIWWLRQLFWWTNKKAFCLAEARV